MNPALAPTDAAPNPMRPRDCPDCGYPFAGLPEQGRCPECGFEYDPGQIVLYGWAAGPKADLGNCRHGKFLLIAVAACVGLSLIAGAVSGRLLSLPGDRFIAPAFAGAAALMAWAAWHRYRLAGRSPGGAPVQVRLFPEGLAQRDGVGPVNLLPWHLDLDVELTRTAPGRYRLVVQEPMWKGGPPTVVADFDFDCEPRVATRIRERIAQWLRLR